MPKFEKLQANEIQKILEYRHIQIVFVLFLFIMLNACSSSVRFTSGASNPGRNSSYPTAKGANSNSGSSSSGGIGTIQKSAEAAAAVGYSESGNASYYGDKFHGRTTASGTIYDQYQLTAAHKSLPFGAKVQVTNKKNGKTVIVEITDRGPFVGGRIIDLSTLAAEELDMIRDGVVPVEILVID